MAVTQNLLQAQKCWPVDLLVSELLLVSPPSSYISVFVSHLKLIDIYFGITREVAFRSMLM